MEEHSDMLKWDGHTHTKFCYHGSSDEQELYLEEAIAQGFERYTMSEHPPLPKGWVNDEKLMEELAMPESELSSYIAYAKEMKARYEGRLEVTIGLELDHLPGHYGYTRRFVEQWGHELEDVVYSVHYLRGAGGMRCIDFTPDDFKEGLLSFYGTMDGVINEYFDHVETAIAWAGKLPMRKRIGHLGLIRKFEKELPPINEALFRSRMEALLPILQDAGVGVDVNCAGLRVPTIGTPYVPDWFITECIKRGIPCVYGSDSHKPAHVGLGWDWFAAQTGR
jgi:histidinol-phosphatase (PHP family)